MLIKFKWKRLFFWGIRKEKDLFFIGKKLIKNNEYVKKIKLLNYDVF